MLPFSLIIWISVIVPPFYMTEPVDVGRLFSQLSPEPQKLVFTNEIPFNNEGGHLQGVQPYYFEGQEYIILSGSSNTYGYLAVAHRDKVRKLHQLMFKPFKHAGGFQVHGDWLAVGIEDNEARNVSVVQIYKLGDPLSDLDEPVAVIKRSGERERATAGAVAIQQLEKTLWVAVGDWSNRHMDFYKADLTSSDIKTQFHKTGEVDMANHPTNDWIDPVVRPYQNINLLRLKDQLYLVGLAGDGNSTDDVVDVFTIEGLSASTPILKKVFSRHFKPTRDTKFGWGAGVLFDGKGRLSVFSCGENIKDIVTVSVYR